VREMAQLVGVLVGNGCRDAGLFCGMTHTASLVRVLIINNRRCGWRLDA
jgi:hypothetical protein